MIVVVVVVVVMIVVVVVEVVEVVVAVVVVGVVVLFGWHYLFNTTSNTASFVVCVVCRVKDHHYLLHHSPRLKEACVRQVVLDKLFLLNYH